MLYGYIRVSTTEQNTDRQVDAMLKREIPRKNLYIDKFTGITADRPEYQRMKRRLRAGDTLFIKSLDRLGRRYNLVLEEWRELVKVRKANVVVLDMPILDTRERGGNLMGKFVADLVLQILSFVSEQEYQNIHERQRQGIEAAKKRGVRFGKPPMPIPEEFYEAAELRRQGKLTLIAAAKRAGMSLTRFHSKYNAWLDKKLPADDVQTKNLSKLETCPYIKRTPNAFDCLYCSAEKCAFDEDFPQRQPLPDKEEKLNMLHRRYQETRAERIEKGLCILCGKRKPEEGKKCCPKCLHDRTMKRRARKEEKAGQEDECHGK